MLLFYRQMIENFHLLVLLLLKISKNYWASFIIDKIATFSNYSYRLSDIFDSAVLLKLFRFSFFPSRCLFLVRVRVSVLLPRNIGDLARLRFVILQSISVRVQDLIILCLYKSRLNISKLNLQTLISTRLSI